MKDWNKMNINKSIHELLNGYAKLKQENAELKKLLNRVLAYETFLISSLVSEITKALDPIRDAFGKK